MNVPTLAIECRTLQEWTEVFSSITVPLKASGKQKMIPAVIPYFYCHIQWF
ncbi:MAG: hypothetical protein O2964_11585 [Verrucomicrobia bacterium]|nr:hypothetical protein [Verrucomicrobiota bacterium]